MMLCGILKSVRWVSMKGCYKNGEGYVDKTAGRAIERTNKKKGKQSNKIPENVVSFRKSLRLLCNAYNVRLLGKVTVIDEKGNRW